MPNMGGDAIDLHYDLSPAERRVLRLVAEGETDGEIEAELDITAAAVHSLIRRFRERTGGVFAESRDHLGSAVDVYDVSRAIDSAERERMLSNVAGMRDIYDSVRGLRQEI